MNLQQQLRVLELDLSGSDIKVGVEKLIRYDIARMLNKHGVSLGAMPIASYKSGKLQNYIKGHLEQGSNYAVLDQGVVLDSQLDGISLLFNYYRPPRGKSVYLEFMEVAKSKSYGGPRKISVQDFDKIVKQSNMKYKPLASRFVEMIDIEDFGRPAPKLKPESEPEPQEIAEAEEKLPEGWEMVVGKKYKLDFKIPKNMMSPRIDFIPFEDFPLDRLEETFVFPRHQRKINRQHVLKMAKAAAEGKFYSNILEVIKKGDKWAVEDGKQSLHMLRFMRDYGGVKTYNLYLLRRLDGKPVEMFEGFNKGKHFNINDRSHMQDDGTIPFYNELAPWLSHYKDQPGKLRFVDMGRAHMYAVENQTHVKDADVLAYIPKIKPGEAKRAKEFLRVMVDVLGEEGSFVKRQVVLSNLYRVFWETNMGEGQLKRVFGVVKKDDDVLALSRSANNEDYEKLYNIVSKDMKKARK